MQDMKKDSSYVSVQPASNKGFLFSKQIISSIAIVSLGILSITSWERTRPWNLGFLDSNTASGAYHRPDLYEAGVVELQKGLDAGHFTSVDLVKAYIARIEEVNLAGPSLRAVLEINPSALAQAAVLDAERSVKGKRSALHGIPVLLKDIIATVAVEGMNTTAGSYSLLGSVVPEDAGVVKRLRKAGAIILGKANLSEFSGMRGNLSYGWSGRGGQSTGAYYPMISPCGSSAGSAVAASIGLATVTLGTETDGSISCPASLNNVVGIKPTLGLTSRAGVIPISIHQDTVGPLTRSVEDGAIVLSVIAGTDPNDNYTFAQPSPVPDYTQALNKDAFRGKRIAVARRSFIDLGVFPDIHYAYEMFEGALKTIEGLGATLVSAELPSVDEIIASRNMSIICGIDFKIQINEYFNSLVENPSRVRDLADLIQFNIRHPESETPPGYDDQQSFERAEQTQGYNASYFDALEFHRELGARRGIDAVLRDNQVDAIVMLGAGTTTASAMVGYPIVTVPLGFFPENTTIGEFGLKTLYPTPGAPIGLAFFGTAYSDFDLIGFAYAYEQATQTRLKRKAYPEAIPATQLKDVV